MCIRDRDLQREVSSVQRDNRNISFQLEQLTDRDKVAAAGFDKALTLLEEPALQSASARLLSTCDNDVFLGEELEGDSYLRRLGDLCSALHEGESEQHRHARAHFAAEADRHLQAVTSGRRTFELEASGWLGVDTGDGEAETIPLTRQERAAERLALLDAAETLLTSRVEAALVESSTGADEFWTAQFDNVRRGGDPDPQLVLGFSKRPDGQYDERLEQLVTDYARGVESRVVRDGEVDSEALAAEEISLHAVFTLRELLDLWEAHGDISAAQAQAVRTFLES